MEFEELYSHICGEMVFNIKELNAFDEGKKCALLYKEAYELKQSINKRLNADEDDELCHLEDILTAIGKECAKQVYNYCQAQRA